MTLNIRVSSITVFWLNIHDVGGWTGLKIEEDIQFMDIRAIPRYNNLLHSD